MDAESDMSRRAPEVDAPGATGSDAFDTAFGDFNVSSDFGEVGDVTRTAAADLFFGDFAPPLDPDLVFECSASMNGEHGAVALYEDRVIVESPDEPDGEAVFSTETVRAWWLVEGETFFALVVDADVLHRTRLPTGFKAVLKAAFTKAFGPATSPTGA
ncbi:hypothetical protein [Frigoribacterium sp. 2355]